MEHTPGEAAIIEREKGDRAEGSGAAGILFLEI